MTETRFFAPANLEEALDMLAFWQGRAVVVNGGTDIVEKVAAGRIRPEAIVHIRALPDLGRIERHDGMVSIGGCATYAEILASPLCAGFRVLREAVAEVGSPPIRRMGTLAGNIGSAMPAADGNTALVALGARVEVVSREGARLVPVEELLLGPGKTDIRPDELIRAVLIPEDEGRVSAFVKVARRRAQDIAQVSVGVCLKMDGGRCASARVALGAVAATAIRARGFEEALRGDVEAGLAFIRRSVPAEAALRSPRNRAYKEAVMGIIVERAVRKALGGTYVR